MIHKYIAALFVACISFATQPAMAAEQVKAGSPEAASLVAHEFMVLFFNVPKADVALTAPSIDGDWAKLQARSPGRVCDMTLVRDAKANPLGWVVQMHTCKK